MESVQTPNTTERLPIAFLEWLPKFFADYEIAAGLRLVPAGVLVEESLAEKIIAGYQKWLAEIGSEQKNPEKLFRKLFGPTEPKLWYALDGKKCIPGFIMPANIPADAKLKIPRYPAGLLDPEGYLHPRDPLLEKTAGLNLRISEQEGMLLELTAGSRKFVCNEAFLKCFSAVVRTSKTLTRQHSIQTTTLRGIFPVLLKLLGNTKPSSQQETILVPEKYKGKPDTLLLRAGGLVFVQQGQNRIVHCYEHRGRGRRNFILQEALLLTDKAGESTVRGFDGDKPRKHCLGRVWSQKMSFHLEMKAFEIYFHQLARSRKMKERFMNRPSVRDVLQSLVPLFRQSAPVNELHILAGISRHRRPYAKYRRSGDWVFVITDKNVLSSCVRLRGLAPEPGRPEGTGQAETSGQPRAPGSQHPRRSRRRNSRRNPGSGRP